MRGIMIKFSDEIKSSNWVIGCEKLWRILTSSTTSVPASRSRRCRAVAKNGFIKVVKLEEKRTDVNIASSMLLDAFNGNADAFVLVSGDTDFIAPVNIIRKDFKKTLIREKQSRGSKTMRLITVISRVTCPLNANCPTPFHTASAAIGLSTAPMHGVKIREHLDVMA